MGYLDCSVRMTIEETGEGFYVIEAYSTRTGETWFAVGRSLSIAAAAVEGCVVGEPMTFDNERMAIGVNRVRTIEEFRTIERIRQYGYRANSNCDMCYGDGYTIEGTWPNAYDVACECVRS